MLRILIIGNDLQLLRADGDVLTQRGMRVYICDKCQNAAEMVEEVKPDLVFVDPKKPDKITTDVYHSLLDNIRYASLPIIFTLSEDDVYLVNRKRTAMKDRRYIISDNIVDAIKMANVLPIANVSRKRVRISNPSYNNISFAYRA
jgi:response regulator RpfG family c-di-GMP phosphodiesterase